MFSAVSPLSPGQQPAPIVVTASSPGLAPATITVVTSVDAQDAVLAVAAANVQTAYFG